MWIKILSIILNETIVNEEDADFKESVQRLFKYVREL